MTVLIFANGDLQSSDPAPSDLQHAGLQDADPHAAAWVRPLLEEAVAVIAANGGARHLFTLEHQPDVVIGDLDSLSADLGERLRKASTLFVQRQPDKDETDLELALLHAVHHFDEPIVVIAGLGGRLDQMLANILLLMHPQLRGRDVSFRTQFQRIWLIEKQAVIRGEPGDTVSLIPLGGDVQVESTQGLRWSLGEETLFFGPARGVSNVMLNDVAHVTIREGHLLCVHTQRGWQR